MSISDQTLVQKCRQGDTAAFESLVGKYQNLVCSVAYSILGDVNQSEDVAQETLLVAWSKLDRLEREASFKSWVCSIARNLARNSLRRHRVPADGAGEEVVADQRESVEESLTRGEEQELVWSVLAELPELYREPLVLFYRQEQSVASVAEALDVSVDVVKQRLSRGRKMLKMEVAAVVQRTLERTSPSGAFTLGVMAALRDVDPGVLAAPVSSAAAKTATGAGAAKSAGWLAVLTGPLIGLAGAAFGFWCSWRAATYQRERTFMVRASLLYAVLLTVFMLPFLAMLLGWRPYESWGQRGYALAFAAWMGSFTLLNLTWVLVTVFRGRRLTRLEKLRGAQPLAGKDPASLPVRWVGRRWRSSQGWLGAPWIDIAFRDSDSGDSESNQPQRPIARGWIAIGDVARGRLIAIGNVAIAPISVGTFSIGLISFGVISLGGVGLGVVTGAAFSLGVVAGGGWAVGGGIAVACYASAPMAIGWQAAKGPLAVARHYALGEQAFAGEANSDLARQHIAEQRFFEFADQTMQWMISGAQLPWLAVILVPLLLGNVGFLRLAYRRVEEAGGEDVGGDATG